jgi:fatty-acid peroxygenase
MKLNNSVPKDLGFDHSIKLLTEGYLFLPKYKDKLKTNLFLTRIMGQKVICMSGKEAAKMFYDQRLFTRSGTMPNRIKETLFGKNSIQTMDGVAHMHRKLMFLSIMSDEHLDKIVNIARKQWIINSARWEGKDHILLFDEVSIMMFQIACKWAGVSLKKSEVITRSKDMSAMIDGFGAVGPRHWKARCARNRSECWARDHIRTIRNGRKIAPTNSALSQIAWHRDLSGDLLDTQTAAVELLNILRPITAIATYVMFGALSLHMYPDCIEKLRNDNADYLNLLTQEIRRYYPFAPFLAARVRRNFKWKNCNFKEGTLVFLDVYGTNHDPEIWANPNVFQPERFKDRRIHSFDFIPQGGGDYQTGTRCPGEGITVELLKVSLDYLANRLEYEVPLQDLSYPLNRIPTLVRSKFVIKEVRKRTIYHALP